MISSSTDFSCSGVFGTFRRRKSISTVTLLSKSSWELRVYYSGFRRLYRAAICQTVICCVWLAGEVWYLIGHFGDFGSEIRYFLCVLLCAGISGGMSWLLHRNPAQVVEGPTVR